MQLEHVESESDTQFPEQNMHTVSKSDDRHDMSDHSDATTAVATSPGFPGMSRICTMLSRVPARPAPGHQMSLISR